MVRYLSIFTGSKTDGERRKSWETQREEVVDGARFGGKNRRGGASTGDEP